MRLTYPSLFTALSILTACPPDEAATDTTATTTATTGNTTGPEIPTSTSETPTTGTTDDETTDAPAAACTPWQDYFTGPVNGVDQASDVVRDADGSVYVVGWVDTTEALNDDDIWVRKYDVTGKEQWTRTFDGLTLSSNERADAVALAPNGDIVVVGNDQDSPGIAGTNIRVLRLSPAGDTLWDTTYVGASGKRDSAGDVIVTDDDRVVVVGNLDNADLDGWIGVFSDVGALIQEQLVTNTPGTREVLHGVASAPGGGFIVVGSAEPSPDMPLKAWLVRLDDGLAKTWATLADDGDAVGVVVSGDAFVVAGTLDSMTTKRDAWLAAYADDGAQTWSLTIDGGAGGIDFANALAIDGAGNLVVGGLDRRLVRGETVLTPWVRQFTSAGVQTWELSGADLASDHRVSAVATTADGCIVAAGVRELVQNDSYNPWTRVVAASP